MPLPQNAKAIYSFLTGAGLTGNAAAGILGNIYGESGGNPESQGTGGWGLIGWTPNFPGQYNNLRPTGNVQKDLANQEQGLLTYIKTNGSIAAINSHSNSPTSAASYFITQFERPANPAGDLPIRAQVANDVAAAAKSGHWPTGGSTPATATSASITGGWIQDLMGAFGIGDIQDLMQRFALIVLGALLLIIGVWRLDIGNNLKPKNAFKSSQGAKKTALKTADQEASPSPGAMKGKNKKRVIALGPNATETDRRMYEEDSSNDPPPF